LIYCDNGNKKEEIKVYYKLARFGDILLTHDFSDGKRRVRGIREYNYPEVTVKDIQFLEDNPELSVQVTGHSLGGAIARCVGETLGLGIVTFNAAAPPSNPVIITSGNEINYHIVFDIISAWQSPGTIRLDKGFRPVKSRSIIPLKWAQTAISHLIEAHRLSNFSNKKVGVQVDATMENNMMKSWFYSLPLILRQFIIFYLMGKTQKISFKLPDIK
jgi:hypothetical protein